MKYKDFVLYMAAWEHDIKVKEEESARNWSFKLTAHSFLHIDTNVLTNYVDKIMEL